MRTPRRERCTNDWVSESWLPRTATSQPNSRCRWAWTDVVAVARHQRTHALHRIDGTVLVHRLDGHDGHVLVVGQVDTGPACTGGKRNTHHERPRNDLVRQEVSYS